MYGREIALRPDHIRKEVDFIYNVRSRTFIVNKLMTGQCFYSLIKKYWIDEDDLISHPFPITAINYRLFYLIGWEIENFHNIRESTIHLIDDFRGIDGEVILYEYERNGHILSSRA